MAVTKGCVGVSLILLVSSLLVESKLTPKVHNSSQKSWPSRSKLDVWTVEEREAFLQQAGSQFPMTHGVLKQIGSKDGVPVKVVEKVNRKSADYAQMQGHADFHRARGRQLKIGDEIEFNLGGNYLRPPYAYFITVSLGSNQQTFNVQVDTGSDLMWVPCNCLQCASDSTFTSDPFSPEASGTTVFEECGSTLCKSLSQRTDSFGCNVVHRDMRNSTDPFCEYWYRYGDNSSTFGNLVEDSFNFKLSTGVSLSPRVIFGCSSIQDGNLVEGTNVLDGLIGLGRGTLSVVNQLDFAQVIDDTFSLCLEGEGSGGHLFMGTNSLPDNAQYIDLLGLNANTFYGVDLMGLQLNGKDVELNTGVFQRNEDASGGTILDSGTTYTILPSSVVESLALALASETGYSFTQLPDGRFPRFLCTLTDGGTTEPDLDSNFPPAAMVFSDNGGTIWDLPASNYLFGVDDFTVCIAALQGGSDSSMSIIGDTWLRNNYVLYDRANDRIGFIPFNSMVFSDNGGTIWDLPASNYLFGVDDFTVCIAALQGGSDSSMSIIGDTWLRNNYVLYDRANDRIGFIPFNCTTLQPLSPTDGPAAPPTQNQLGGGNSTANPLTQNQGSSNPPKSGSSLLASVSLAVLASLVSGALIL
eukprot:jgi/Mesen1/5376/ME000268S04571